MDNSDKVIIFGGGAVVICMCSALGMDLLKKDTAPSNNSNEPTQEVQTLSPLELTALLTPSAVPSETPIPTATMALSNGYNPLMEPTKIIDMNNCFIDAFEPVPINNYRLTVARYDLFDIVIFPGFDSSFNKTFTKIKTTNIENIEQYFIIDGMKAFDPNEKIEATYWRFKEGFQLDSLYLGCFVGFPNNNNNSSYGDPIRSELENGRFEGFIEFNGIRYMGPGE
jgi:hypothetical protein